MPHTLRRGRDDGDKRETHKIPHISSVWGACDNRIERINLGRLELL